MPFNALFYGSYESCCAALMRAEGLKSKDDLGMSRIFFAGGLRGWLQTVPAPGVAAAGEAEACPPPQERLRRCHIVCYLKVEREE